MVMSMPALRTAMLKYQKGGKKSKSTSSCRSLRRTGRCSSMWISACQPTPMPKSKRFTESLSMSILPACIMCTSMCLVPEEARKGHQVPGAGVRGGCEHQCGDRNKAWSSGVAARGDIMFAS